MITFLLVVVFRKDDSKDKETDPDDDGSPIYVDELVGDLNVLNKKEVSYSRFFPKYVIYLNYDKFFL